MPTFVKIKRLRDLDFGQVEFYSLSVDEEDDTEFEAFLKKHKDIADIKDDFQNLLAFIKTIAVDGADERFFRFEENAQAIPGKSRIPYFQMDSKHQIRIYCLRLSERVVFLFNGGIKTNQDPKKCKNCSLHFSNAQTFAKAINGLVKEGEILIDSDSEKVVHFPNEFVI